MKTKFVVVTALIATTSIMVCTYFITNAASTQVFDPDMLPVVLQGCKLTASSVKSGKGRVTVQQHIRKREGGLLATETVYEVASCGEKFKVQRQIKFVVNEPGDQTETGLSLTAPGTVRTEQVAFDGQEVRRLEVDTRKAVIADLHTSTGDDELTNYKLYLAVGCGDTLGSGLCDLQAFYESLLFPGSTGTGLAVVGGENLQGDDCVILECIYDFSKHSGEHFHDIRRFWVNPAKGYTVSKLRIWSEGGVYHERTLVCEWDVNVREYSDGIWGPDEIVKTQYGIDPATKKYVQNEHTVIKFDPDFALNVPVSKQDLSLTFPSGTTVTDQNIDATYTVP